LARFRTTTILRPLNNSLFIACPGSSDKRCPPSPSIRQTPGPGRSGNLRDPGRLHHRRTALPLREARGFALVGIDAAELFSIRVINAYEEMMVLAAASVLKAAFPFFEFFFSVVFVTVTIPVFGRLGSTISRNPVPHKYRGR